MWYHTILGLVSVLSTQLTEAVCIVVDVVSLVMVLGSLWALEAVGTTMVTNHKGVCSVFGSEVEPVVVAGITGA